MRKIRVGLGILALSSVSLVTSATPALAHLQLDTTNCGVGLKLELASPLHVHVLCG